MCLYLTIVDRLWNVVFDTWSNNVGDIFLLKLP
jgi:hypothetical protein